jgi:S1-C subfamily serine protease
MPLWNLLAVGAAVLLTAFVSVFGSDAPAATPKPVVEMPTLGVVPSAAPLSQFLAPLSLTTPAATSSPLAGSPSPTTTLDLNQTVLVPKALLPAATASATPTVPAKPSETTNQLNATVGLVRGALVNIICIPKSRSLRSASASGVVIDSRGIILTVAHMAQYFLLADQPKQDSVSCVIRTGSPAAAAYTASLAYISPDWVRANDTTLVEEAPTGSGENDFALLAIEGSATDAPLPSSFPAIPLAGGTPRKGDAVTVGSYGAEFLTGAQVERALYPIVVFGSVGNRYTFDTDTVDLLAIDRTAAAQEGSSGGGVVNADDKLIGLITTSSSGDIAGRDLHAITPRHIRASFEEDTGEDLDDYLASRTPAEMVSDFSDEAETLGKLLYRAVK